MAPTKPSESQKKQRKHLSWKEKLEIIELKEKGYGNTKIAREKNVPESSVRTIYENRDKIRKQGIQTADYDAKTIKPRSRAKLEMEQLLFIWIEDCAKRFDSENLLKSGKHYVCRTWNFPRLRSFGEPSHFHKFCNFLVNFDRLISVS